MIPEIIKLNLYETATVFRNSNVLTVSSNRLKNRYTLRFFQVNEVDFVSISKLGYLLKIHKFELCGSEIYRQLLSPCEERSERVKFELLDLINLIRYEYE